MLYSAGYGYAASEAAVGAATAAGHPPDEGLWLLDSATGASRLLLSLKQLYTVTFEGACALLPILSAVLIRRTA